jgi:hypothetical protein
VISVHRPNALLAVFFLAAAATIGAQAAGATSSGTDPQRAGGLHRSVDGPALRVQRQVTANRRGVMRIAVTCRPTASESCDGRLSLVDRRETCACGAFGTATFSIPSGEAAELRVKLNRKMTALLVKQKLLRVKSIVVANDATNKVSTTVTPLAIRLAG